MRRSGGHLFVLVGPQATYRQCQALGIMVTLFHALGYQTLLLLLFKYEIVSDSLAAHHGL